MKLFITLNPRKTKRFISCDSKANLLNLLSMFVLKMLKVKYFKESCPIWLKCLWTHTQLELVLFFLIALMCDFNRVYTAF